MVKKRSYRSPSDEEQIADLEAEIETIKARIRAKSMFASSPIPTTEASLSR